MSRKLKTDKNFISNCTISQQIWSTWDMIRTNNLLKRLKEFICGLTAIKKSHYFFGKYNPKLRLFCNSHCRSFILKVNVENVFHFLSHSLKFHTHSIFARHRTCIHYQISNPKWLFTKGISEISRFADSSRVTGGFKTVINREKG